MMSVVTNMLGAATKKNIHNGIEELMLSHDFPSHTLILIRLRKAMLNVVRYSRQKMKEEETRWPRPKGVSRSETVRQSSVLAAGQHNYLSICLISKSLLYRDS
jgi:hypothetical protein